MASLQHEPLDVEQRMKEDSDIRPVGLKNVGNTCYFNSLLQALFMMPNISQKILEAKLPGPQPPVDGKKFSMKEMRYQCAQNMVNNI